jgi:hypothetical protein
VIYGDNNWVSCTEPLHKKGSEVDPAGTAGEGDSVCLNPKEVGLTERCKRKVRGQGILFFEVE